MLIHLTEGSYILWYNFWNGNHTINDKVTIDSCLSELLTIFYGKLESPFKENTSVFNQHSPTWEIS